MKFLNKFVQCILLFLLSISLLIGLVQSLTESISIKPDSEVNQTLYLLSEDRVLLQIKILKDTSDGFSSALILPNGTVIEFGEANNIDYRFICEIEGEYILKFVNSDKQNDKLVTLNYEIQNYVFGIPKMLFLTLIIVGICLVGVVIFVFLGKPYHY